MSAPLEIPKAARRAFVPLLNLGMQADSWAHVDETIRLIAAPVVAAELRRLAGVWAHTGVMYSVLRDLRARADEIEAAS